MPSEAPRIASLATALPPHRMSQAEAREGARRLFAGLPELDRLLGVFDRSGVESRALVHPRDWYLEPRPFGERNREYLRAALELGGRAVAEALDQAGIAPDRVDAFVFTTTTGLATPSVDARLAAALGFRPGVRRIPLFGLGCAGGAAAVALAADRLRERPGETVVVLSVELCSLTLLMEEASKVNLVGTALFGDGAAAAVLTAGSGDPAGGRRGPRVLASESHLFPGTGGLMGWDFSERGFGLVLSTRVPAFIHEAFPEVARRFLAGQGVAPEQMTRFALHPGGRQVLAAYRRGLGLTDGDLRASTESLRRNGNLSSAAVLFALAELDRGPEPEPGEYGLMAAMGPGFASELLLLGW